MHLLYWYRTIILYRGFKHNKASYQQTIRVVETGKLHHLQSRRCASDIFVSAIRFALTIISRKKCKAPITVRISATWNNWNCPFNLSDLNGSSQRFTTLRLQDTTQYACNLGFIFDEHLSSPIRSLHCLNPAVITFVLSAVSVRTLTFTLRKQLPPPSYTPGLTTVTLCTIVFRNIKYIVSKTSKMLLLELLSRLQNCNTSLYSEISSLA